MKHQTTKIGEPLTKNQQLFSNYNDLREIESLIIINESEIFWLKTIDPAK
jgi:hypothetical protein